MKLTTWLKTATVTICMPLLMSACDFQTGNETLPPQASSPPDGPKIPAHDATEVKASSTTEPLPTISSASNSDGYQEIEWDALIPEDYHPQAILEKYQEQLESLDDSDPKAMQLYGTIQAELDNAPVNEAMNGKKIKLPGFIAPLENIDGKVTEFLLVPYFGACIHVPPPPVNQTVLVKPRQGNAIDADDSNLAFWVKGTITTDKESTDIGSAGYRIEQAEIEIF